jgi:hypothetical protein
MLKSLKQSKVFSKNKSCTWHKIYIIWHWTNIVVAEFWRLSVCSVFGPFHCPKFSDLDIIRFQIQIAYHTSFWKVDSCSAFQDIPWLLCNPKVQYHVQEGPSVNPIISQSNPVHSFLSSFSKIRPLHAIVSQVVSSLQFHVFPSSHVLPISSSTIWWLTYLLRGLNPQANYTDRAMPISADRGCHVVSMTDPYGHILGFLDRTCCVNPIDNTHYAPITTTPSTRTKYLHKILP